MLEHSGLPQVGASGNLNGFAMPDQQLQRLQHQPNPPPVLPLNHYPDYRAPFHDTREQVHGYETSVDGVLHSPQNINKQPGQRTTAPFSELTGSQAPAPSSRGYRASDGQPASSKHASHRSSVAGSGSVSPEDSKERVARSSDVGTTIKRHGSVDEGKAETRDNDDEKPPPWSEMKTKAGKDRKRLPLACIACRRKKIRCSGEKPACKHCLRSRIPCVYKVTARKAAPRTDYMAMLDKR